MIENLMSAKKILIAEDVEKRTANLTGIAIACWETGGQ
jgi:hypothetical protein